jgi:hypothetical protein
MTPISNGIINGAFVEVNEKYCKKWVTNITELSLISCYPTELINILKTEESSLPNLSEVMEYVQKLRSEIKLLNPNNIDKNKVNINLKSFLNGIYGLLLSPYSLLKTRVDVAGIVVNNVREIQEYLYKTFSDNILYVDTDISIYRNFNDIEKDVTDYLNTTIHTFDIEQKNGIYFEAKKKYIIQDKNNNLKIQGIRTI